MIRSAVKRQRGATLIITLIMLVILTLFAVTGFNLSSVNLKVVGNFQQQKAMEAVAQQAIEQIISTATPFSLTPTASTVCVNGSGGGCTGGYMVAVSAPQCHYTTTAQGYTKKVGELTPEDTDWEIRAQVSDPLGAQAAIVQGVGIRLLAGNCP